MKKLLSKKVSLLLAVFVFFSCFPLMQAGGLSAYAGDASAGVDTSWELASELGPGWTLGSALDSQDLRYGFVTKGFLGSDGFELLETASGNPVTEKALIDAAADRGFRSVRIPVSFYNHMLESRPRDDSGCHPGTTVDPEWLDRISQVVDWSLDAGMYVILSDGCDTGMMMDRSWIFAESDTYEDNAQQLTNLWSQLAERFKDYDTRLVFESMSEAVNSDRSLNSGDYLDFQAAHDLNQAFIETVRNTGGNNASRFLVLPVYAADPRPLFVDQNFYKPFTDTVKDRLFFSVHCYYTDPDMISLTFKYLYEKAVRYNMPFIVSECGAEISTASERAGIYAAYAAEAAKYRTSAFVMDDGGTSEYSFGLVDRSRTTKTGNIQYLQGAESVVDAFFRSAESTEALSDEDLAKSAEDMFVCEAFTPLNQENYDHLYKGSYTDTNAAASNPRSYYTPLPADQACLRPYMSLASVSRLSVVLPDGITITIRELDERGFFIRSKYITVSGGNYIPSPDARYIALTIRSSAPDMTFDDYLRMVKNGELWVGAPASAEPGYRAALSELSENSDGSVSMKWEGSDTAAGYVLLRKTAEDAKWDTLKELTQSEAVSAGHAYTDTSAEPETEYWYTIRAYERPDENTLFWTDYDRSGLYIRTSARSASDDGGSQPEDTPRDPQPGNEGGSGNNEPVNEDSLHTLSLPAEDLDSLETAVLGIYSEDDVPESSFGRLRARGFATGKHSIRLKWVKPKGTAKFVIYGCRCNHKGHSYSFKNIRTLGSGKRSLTLRKLGGKKLKKGCYYKFIIAAADKNGKLLAVSKTVHTATDGGRYGNYKAVKKVRPNRSSIGIKKGKLRRLKVKELRMSGPVARHRKLSWESSDTTVAKVIDGKVRAIGTGKCRIWAYSQNGVYTTYKITVK